MSDRNLSAERNASAGMKLDVKSSKYGRLIVLKQLKEGECNDFDARLVVKCSFPGSTVNGLSSPSWSQLLSTCSARCILDRLSTYAPQSI